LVFVFIIIFLILIFFGVLVILMVATLVVAVVMTCMVVMAMLICLRPPDDRGVRASGRQQCPSLGKRDTGVWFSGRSGVSNRYLDFRTSGL